MSIFTDMFPVELYVDNPLESLSGAPKEDFVLKESIDVAIYKVSGYRNVSNVKYQESTHDGVTFYKGFEEGKTYQLRVGMTIYQVIDFNCTSKFTTLVLKVVTYG